MMQFNMENITEISVPYSEASKYVSIENCISYCHNRCHDPYLYIFLCAAACAVMLLLVWRIQKLKKQAGLSSGADKYRVNFK